MIKKRVKVNILPVSPPPLPIENYWFFQAKFSLWCAKLLFSWTGVMLMFSQVLLYRDRKFYVGKLFDIQSTNPRCYCCDVRCVARLYINYWVTHLPAGLFASTFLMKMPRTESPGCPLWPAMSTFPPTMAMPRGCPGSLATSTRRFGPQNLADIPTEGEGRSSWQ